MNRRVLLLLVPLLVFWGKGFAQCGPIDYALGESETDAIECSSNGSAGSLLRDCAAPLNHCFDCHIINGDFENYNDGVLTQEIEGISFWRRPFAVRQYIPGHPEVYPDSISQKYLYHNSVLYSTPVGAQRGNAYVTLNVAYSDYNVRKTTYFMQKLVTPLTANKRYVGWMYVKSPDDTVGIGGPNPVLPNRESYIWNMGMLFGDTLPLFLSSASICGSISFNIDSYRYGTPQVQPQPFDYINNKKTWKPVFGIFTPPTNYKYVTIGRFAPQSLYDTGVSNPAGLDSTGFCKKVYGYSISGTYVPGATINGPPSMDIRIDVDNVGVVEAPNAGEDVVLECGNTQEIGWQDPRPCAGSYDGWGFQWSPASAISGPSNLLHVVAAPSKTTSYILTVTLPDGQSYQDTMIVRMVGNELAYNDSGPIQAECGAKYVLGYATCISDGESYSWSPTKGLDNPLSLHPTATIVGGITYTLTVNRIYGPTTISTVTFEVPNTSEFSIRVVPDCSEKFFGGVALEDFIPATAAVNDPETDWFFGSAGSGPRVWSGGTLPKNRMLDEGVYSAQRVYASGCRANAEFIVWNKDNPDPSVRTSVTFRDIDIFFQNTIAELHNVTLKGSTRVFVEGGYNIVQDGCNPSASVIGQIYIDDYSSLTIQDSISIQASCVNMWAGIVFGKSATLNTSGCIKCKIADADWALAVTYDAGGGAGVTVKNTSFINCRNGIAALAMRVAAVPEIKIGGCRFATEGDGLKLPYSAFSTVVGSCSLHPIQYFNGNGGGIAVNATTTEKPVLIQNTEFDGYKVGLLASTMLTAPLVTVSKCHFRNIKLAGLALLGFNQLEISKDTIESISKATSNFQRDQIYSGLVGMGFDFDSANTGFVLQQCSYATLAQCSINGTRSELAETSRLCGIHVRNAPNLSCTDNLIQNVQSGLIDHVPDYLDFTGNIVINTNEGLYFDEYHNYAPTFYNNVFQKFKSAIVYNYIQAHNPLRAGNLLLGKMHCNMFDFLPVSDGQSHTCIDVRSLQKRGFFSDAVSLTASNALGSSNDKPIGSIFPVAARDRETSLLLPNDPFRFYWLAEGYSGLSNNTSYAVSYQAYKNEVLGLIDAATDYDYPSQNPGIDFNFLSTLQCLTLTQSVTVVSGTTPIERICSSLSIPDVVWPFLP